MNIDSRRILPEHYPHFDLLRKIQGLRKQRTEFKLHEVFPVNSLAYMHTGIVSVQVSLATEIDKELFEAWLDEQVVPDDFVIRYKITGQSMHDRMAWDIEDPIEYYCANGCGTEVRASDGVEQWIQDYEYCEACMDRGE